MTTLQKIVKAAKAMKKAHPKKYAKWTDYVKAASRQIKPVKKSAPKKKIGAVIIAPISQQKIQQLAVAFVVDTSLYSNGEKVEQNMQEIINTYRRLYNAMRGTI